MSKRPLIVVWLGEAKLTDNQKKILHHIHRDIEKFDHTPHEHLKHGGFLKYLKEKQSDEKSTFFVYIPRIFDVLEVSLANNANLWFGVLEEEGIYHFKHVTTPETIWNADESSKSKNLASAATMH